MYCGDEVSAIVGDIGTCDSKFGFAGEDFPKVVCPSAVGSHSTPLKKSKSFTTPPIFSSSSSLWTATEDPMHLFRPYSDSSTPCNWDAMEALWNYAYESLSLDPTEHPVLASVPVTCTTTTPAAYKSSYLEMMFESISAPSMYLAHDAVLSAFSHGNQTALVVDCGAGSARVVPVVDGFVLKSNLMSDTSLGGDALTTELRSLVGEEKISESRYCALMKSRCGKSAVKNIPKSTETYMKHVMWQEMKDSVCQMSLTTPSDDNVEDFHLPDGTILSVVAERYKLPELLWENKKNDSDKEGGLHRMVYTSIQQSDPDLRPQLLSNVLVCGGGSAFPNFTPRFHAEVLRLIPPSFKVRLVSGSALEKRFSVYTGGSILASLGTFQQLWISKAEYQERGAHNLVTDARRCP